MSTIASKSGGRGRAGTGRPARPSRETLAYALGAAMTVATLLRRPTRSVRLDGEPRPSRCFLPWSRVDATEWPRHRRIATSLSCVLAPLVVVRLRERRAPAGWSRSPAARASVRMVRMMRNERGLACRIDVVAYLLLSHWATVELVARRLLRGGAVQPRFVRSAIATTMRGPR